MDNMEQLVIEHIELNYFFCLNDQSYVQGLVSKTELKINISNVQFSVKHLLK